MKRWVDVEFNGELKQLKFGFNSVCELEEHFGKGLMAIFKEEQIGFRTLRVLYWAGLKWKDKGITIERVGNMLEQKLEEEDTTIDELMNPVMDALKRGLPKLFGDVESNESTGEQDQGNA